MTRLPMSACREQIDRFLNRALGEWTGLDAGCTTSDVVTALPVEEGEGLAHAGERNVAYTFRALCHPGFGNPVFFYFDGDALSAIATDYWSFNREECAALLAQLGDPPHRLVLHWRDDTIADGERVYPERGLTIGVVPATGLIVSVMVYPSCTLEAYLERYYRTAPAREFRPPR